MFLEKNIIIKITQVGMILLAEIFSFLSIYVASIRCFDKYFSMNMDYYTKFLIVICSFIIVHYLMGYILLLSSKMHVYSFKREEYSIKSDFLLSYLITTSYLAFIVIFPGDLQKYVVSGVIGVIICYILNFKILLNIIKNPKNIKLSQEDESGVGKVMLASLLIVAMIIINLYLGVCITNAMEPNAFSNNPSNFDLLYYTIVTFTTIGFGDISPISIPSKIIAIIISLTSIICLTVFLGNIYSYRGK